MSIRVEQGNKDGAFAVRKTVFMDEQGFENEFDEIDDDPTTIHMTTLYDDELIGCARIFPDKENDGRYIFGRLAILPEYRHRGFAGRTLEESETAAWEAGAREVHLHAQYRITSFYEAYGYTQYGEIELDEHVEHIWMRKIL